MRESTTSHGKVDVVPDIDGDGGMKTRSTRWA